MGQEAPNSTPSRGQKGRIGQNEPRTSKTATKSIDELDIEASSKPTGCAANGSRSSLSKCTTAKPESGSTGTRTQNQRLKRAIVSICKMLVTSVLRFTKFLLLSLLLKMSK